MKYIDVFETLLSLKNENNSNSIADNIYHDIFQYSSEHICHYNDRRFLVCCYCVFGPWNLCDVSRVHAKLCMRSCKKKVRMYLAMSQFL